MSGFDFPFDALFDIAVSVETVNVQTKLDHVALAIGRLTEQFKHKPNIVALVRLFAQRYNDLEDAFWDLLTKTDVYNGFGATLDQIGKVVGQARAGLVDADYQRYLAARIATNNSDGTLEDLIGIARLIINDVTAQMVLDVRGTAAFSARVAGIVVSDPLANILVDFLQEAASGGVRAIVETSPALDSDTWCMALAAFASGSTLVSATTLPVDSTAGFPASGSLRVDEGLASADLSVTYNGVTSNSFLNVTGLAHAHSAGSEVTLAGAAALGKGMGDTSDLSVGGQLISARDAHYP